MRKTPLNRIHHEMGARMVEFAGWEMPVQYQSALEEHRAVRNAVGVFDVSHMGQVEITGPDAIAFVQRLTCNDAGRLADGQAQYSAFLTDRGTFVDDIVVYRLGPERIFICVNAATLDKDMAWLRSHSSGSARLEDRSDEFAQIAVQGPKSLEALKSLTEIDLSSLKFYRCCEGEMAGAPALISRTGYTGELGFEIYLPSRFAEQVWTAVFVAGSALGIRAAGLAARNTLRLEMKYALYGNDIDEKRTPYEAGLGWIVKLGTGFIGEAALTRQKEAGVSEQLAGFELLDPGVVRDGFSVYVDGKPAGTVTSGGFSPTLGKSIGLTYLPLEQTQPGTELEVDIRGRRRKGRVVQTPFLRRP